LEEADESLYWLQIIFEAGLTKDHCIESLMQEAHELTAIFSATTKTAKSKIKK
jgi:four helix bundle protein